MASGLFPKMPAQWSSSNQTAVHHQSTKYSLITDKADWTHNQSILNLRYRNARGRVNLQPSLHTQELPCSLSKWTSSWKIYVIVWKASFEIDASKSSIFLANTGNTTGSSTTKLFVTDDAVSTEEVYETVASMTATVLSRDCESFSCFPVVLWLFLLAYPDSAFPLPQNHTKNDHAVLNPHSALRT